MIEILDLRERPLLLPALARLRCDTFFQQSSRTLADDLAGLEQILAGDGFEQAVVAQCDGAFAGGCLLVREEIDPVHDVSPWLAGLVVAEQFRGKGIGAALVRTIEAHAVEAGVGTLYLYADTAEPFYLARGWVVEDRATDAYGPFALMRRDLTSAADVPPPQPARPAPPG